MTPRILAALLALLFVGDSAIETDPFLAAYAGKSGKDAVAGPSFDAELEAISWSLRPRREIVDALAARLLRGEAGDWYVPSKSVPALPAPPSRIPADFESGKFEVVDRLASWVPADAAVVFFGSLSEAENAIVIMEDMIPRLLPGICGGDVAGRRKALRRAIDMLLLPTIWKSNPGVRTGLRQCALVVSDPDVRWAPDIAFLCEVDDASLVSAHRQATFSWEIRGNRRLRVDGLDAESNDGSIRSYFAVEGGVAVWSTTKSLRLRILHAGRGTAPCLLRPDARAYALMKRSFSVQPGIVPLVIPDEFTARVSSPGVRMRRAASLRCEAARLLVDARELPRKPSDQAAPRPSCPTGGEITARYGDSGSSCTLHGTAASPTPLGDLLEAGPCAADSAAIARLAEAPDPILDNAMPVAANWLRPSISVLVPGGRSGRRLLDVLSAPALHEGEPQRTTSRVLVFPAARADGGGDLWMERLSGLHPVTGDRLKAPVPGRAPPPRESGGLLELSLLKYPEAGSAVRIEWR